MKDAVEEWIKLRPTDELTKEIFFIMKILTGTGSSLLYYSSNSFVIKTSPSVILDTGYEQIGV